MKAPYDFNDPNRKKDTPFKVPDNYFEKLPRNIMDRAHQKSGTYFFWNRYKIRLAVAAILIGLIAIFFPGKNSNQPQNTNDILVNVSDEAIQEYLLAENIAYEEILASTANEDVLFNNVLMDLDISEADYTEIEEELLY